MRGRILCVDGLNEGPRSGQAAAKILAGVLQRRKVLISLLTQKALHETLECGLLHRSRHIFYGNTRRAEPLDLAKQSLGRSLPSRLQILGFDLLEALHDVLKLGV